MRQRTSLALVAAALGGLALWWLFPRYDRSAGLGQFHLARPAAIAQARAVARANGIDATNWLPAAQSEYGQGGAWIYLWQRLHPESRVFSSLVTPYVARVTLRQLDGGRYATVTFNTDGRLVGFATASREASMVGHVHATETLDAMANGVLAQYLGEHARLFRPVNRGVTQSSQLLYSWEYSDPSDSPHLLRFEANFSEEQLVRAELTAEPADSFHFAHIDPALLNKHEISMWWAAGVNKGSVAELAVCYMILSVRRVHEFSSTLRAGKWMGPVGFGGDLRGKTVGIHGCGHIGKEVAKLLQPFGVRLIACDKVDISTFCKEWNVESVAAEELWARSDVLTIHLPKNVSTIGLYTGAVLARLKPGMVLINCARGGLVEETGLAEQLKSGRIAAAAFDVFAVEPANGNPLLDIPTLFASPHIGATTHDSWRAMLRSGMEGIEKAWRPQPGVYPFD